MIQRSMLPPAYRSQLGLKPREAAEVVADFQYRGKKTPHEVQQLFRGRLPALVLLAENAIVRVSKVVIEEAILPPE